MKSNRREFLKGALAGIFGALLTWAGVLRANEKAKHPLVDGKLHHIVQAWDERGNITTYMDGKEEPGIPSLVRYCPSPDTMSVEWWAPFETQEGIRGVTGNIYDPGPVPEGVDSSGRLVTWYDGHFYYDGDVSQPLSDLEVADWVWGQRTEGSEETWEEVDSDDYL